METVDEIKVSLAATEFWREAVSAAFCELIVAAADVTLWEVAVANSMVRVLVGVTVSYNVMVVQIVVVDVSSAAELVASSGEKVVVVAPVIVNNPPPPDDNPMPAVEDSNDGTAVWMTVVSSGEKVVVVAPVIVVNNPPTPDDNPGTAV